MLFFYVVYFVFKLKDLSEWFTNCMQHFPLTNGLFMYGMPKKKFPQISTMCGILFEIFNLELPDSVTKCTTIKPCNDILSLKRTHKKKKNVENCCHMCVFILGTMVKCDLQ